MEEALKKLAAAYSSIRVEPLEPQSTGLVLVHCEDASRQVVAKCYVYPDGSMSAVKPHEPSRDVGEVVFRT